MHRRMHAVEHEGGRPTEVGVGSRLEANYVQVVGLNLRCSKTPLCVARAVSVSDA